MRIVYSFTLAVIVFFLSLLRANAQSESKLMSYNLLNYQSSDTTRNVHFRAVINSSRPDILVVQEIVGLTSVNVFRRQVMNAVSYNYASGFFIDGPDTDNAIFYDSSKFRFIFNTAIPTEYRNLNEFRILHKSTGDTLRIYACHLKADTGEVNRQRRAAQVDSLRKRTDALHEGASFITCGDFNIYSSTEPAYQKLLQNNFTDGNFNDPVSMTGVWNNQAYSIRHTQSTRRRSFGGGATGGLDDRFDLILNCNSSISGNGKIRFVQGTLTAYGNDGQHYNDSINRPPNIAVGQQIADALEFASDHLPVTSVYRFYPSSTAINVTAVPEGYFDANTNRLNINDTFTVFLRSSSFPFSKIDSAQSVVDSVTHAGQFVFTNTLTGTYYIVIEGRNTIETWSRSGGTNITAGIVNSYDFSSDQSSAYGNNLLLKSGKYCIYSGDTNNDGIVDANDLSEADNDAFAFLTGYIDTDVNGDLSVDASDIVIIDNNAFRIVSSITP